MKTLYITFIVLIGVILSSCEYSIDNDNLKTFSPIEISANEVVYTKQGVEFVFDITVKSDKEVTYEWSYGSIKGDFPNLADTTVISHSKNVNYTFLKSGNYVLRLMADNGETRMFKYFNLYVQSDFDRGILVLCEDEQHKGSLGYIKYRSEQDLDNNEQYIWSDLIGELHPEIDIMNPTDMYMSKRNQSEIDYMALLIGAKNPGLIYKFNPVTLDLEMLHKMDQEYPNSAPLQFIGEYSASSDFYCFIASSDNFVYRYDFYADLIGLRSNTMLPVSKGYEGYDGSKRIPFLYAENHIITAGGSPKEFIVPTDREVINMAYMRTVSGTKKLNVIFQSTTNPSTYYTASFSTSLTKTDGGTFTSNGEVAIDKNSIFVTTGANQFAYYNYKDKIYRWDVTNTSAINVSLPLIDDFQRNPEGLSMIPDGEQICAMSNTVNYTDMSQADTKLIVATYNPTRAGDKKGSVYVFDLADNSLVEKYEGLFDKPIKVMYKYAL